LEIEPLLASAAFGTWNIQLHPITFGIAISIIVVLLLLLSSALISGSEVAYFSLSASDKQKLKTKGKTNERTRKNLEHPEKLLVNEEMVRESMGWWREHLESDRATIKRHPNLHVLTMKYEDFHADIEASRRRMYEFLAVDPELADDIPDRLQPVFDAERPNEFNRKGRIGDWKNYVTDEARQWINAEAGGELIRQGYVDSLDW
jgi:hypothetical protein